MALGEMEVDHRLPQVGVAEEQLNGAQVGAAFQQMVAKQWRSVWGCIGLLTPARLADSWQACQTTLSLMGSSAVCQRPPGNSQTAGLQFQVGQQMEEVFQALIDRSRSLLNLNRVKTIFGDKNRRQHRRRNQNPTRWGVVVETPMYDLTVFKVHHGKLTLKIYTKGERVLRIEVIVHNTKEFRGGRSLEYFPKSYCG